MVRTPRFSAGGGSASGRQCGYNMYYVYILRSQNFGRHYIGSTEDVGQRAKLHNAGAVRTTKAYTPWEVMHYEVFPDRTHARRREIHLKRNYQARKEIFDKYE